MPRSSTAPGQHDRIHVRPLSVRARRTESLQLGTICPPPQRRVPCLGGISKGTMFNSHEGVVRPSEEATGQICAGPAVEPKYFSISDLADRWRCSRGTVYNVIRGERVLDFAASGCKGRKLVPAAVVHRIEQRRMKVFR